MSEDKPWRDEETLRELYVEKEMTLREVADEIGCDNSTVHRWLDRHGIETRMSGREYGEGQPWRDEESLRELYVEKEMSTREIADELGCGQQTVSRWLNRHGIETRLSASEIKKQQPISMTMNRGYEVFKPRIDGEGYTVFHHRLLATVKYDLDELAGKDVHHKNGIKWDNRLENLEALTPQEHKAEHCENSETPWRDEEAMHELYVEKEMSTREIADELGCGHKTVLRWLNRHGIETREKWERPQTSTDQQTLNEFETEVNA